MRPVALLLGAAGLLSVAPIASASDELLLMDRSSLRGAFHMHASRSAVDRRMADPEEDDEALRVALLERFPDFSLCADGKLQNAGTEEVPLIGCCNAKCFTCMAQFCGMRNRGISLLDNLDFPHRAPVCCHSFYNFRTEQEEGMMSKICGDHTAVGCMLPDTYQVSFNYSAAPSMAPSVFEPNATTDLSFHAQTEAGASDFNCSIIAQAMAEFVLGVNEEDVSCTGVTEIGGRRLQGAWNVSDVQGIPFARHSEQRRLQVSSRANLVQMRIVKDILEVRGTGGDVHASSAWAPSDGAEDVQRKLYFRLVELFNGTMLEAFEERIVEIAINANDMGMDELKIEAGTLSVTPSFEGEGPEGPEPSTAPSAAPTDEGDSISIAGGDSNNQAAFGSGLITYALVGIGGAFLLVLGTWWRCSTSSAANREALMQLKVDPDPTFVDVLSGPADTGSKVYLPPILNAQTAAKYNASRASNPLEARMTSRAQMLGAINSSTSHHVVSTPESGRHSGRQNSWTSVGSESTLNSDADTISSPSGRRSNANAYNINELNGLLGEDTETQQSDSDYIGGIVRPNSGPLPYVREEDEEDDESEL